MKVKIWGCRGSTPAPLKPQQVEEKIVRAIFEMPDIDTGDESAVRSYVRGLDALDRGTAGGNTTCVEVQAGGATLVIDAGTGIRELGLELMKGPFGRGEGEMHLFFSHPHWDHIQGFPFFIPAYIPGNRIVIYSVHDLQKALVEQQRFLNFPVPMSSMEASIEYVGLEVGQPFTVGDVRVNSICNVHPGDSYGYRIEDDHSTFVFASDSEFKHLDDASVRPHIAFFEKADALIFDAQYTLGEGWVKEDWGHSSAMIGVEMALAASVGRLILFHHDPTNDDTVLQRIRADAQAYRDELGGHEALDIIVAYEGLELDLAPASAVGEAFRGREQASGPKIAPILVSTEIFDEQSVQQVADKLVVLDEQVAGKGRIIDLAQVETLTTASLKQLVELQNEQGQAPLVLAAPSPSALRVIELGGFLEFFAIYPTVEAAQTAVAARERARLPGHVLGKRYLIERVAAEGRMGAVLIAGDQQTEGTVAIRIIDPAYSEEKMQRLFSQRDVLLAADHPNLLPVIDLAIEEEIAYLVERYHPGKTLETLLQEHPEGLPFDRAMEIALAVVAGIVHVHGLGIVHGNLKTDKIYIDGDRIQVGGIALGRLDEGLNLLEAPRLRQVVAYLAPEQVIGRPIDARTDLYALGVILYQLFSGVCPFDGNEREVLQAHLDLKPPPPRYYQGQISPSLDHLILKLLAKSPAHRYSSAAQVQRILLALNDGDASHILVEDTFFVAREDELKLMGELWEKARSGQGQLLLISGEQGVGKTRLTEEFAEQAHAQVVLLGHGRERQGGRALSPFAEALLSYLKTIPPELFDDRAQELIGEFAAVIPDVRELLPDLSAPAAMEPEQEQLRRMNSMTRFMSMATSNRPWILILDDMQWADEGSLALLRYLSFDLPRMPLLIVVAYRQSALPPAHPLHDLLATLSDHESISRIKLDRFNRRDLEALLVNEWDSQVPEELLETIFRRTGGNPLFIREVIHSLVAEKLVSFERGVWRYPQPEAVQLPQSLQAVVRRRVSVLDVNAQTLLQQAAVLGQEFQIDVLGEMSELAEWPLLENLDSALQNGFVREAVSEGYLRFQHHAVRRALYDVIPAVRRRLWHKLAGEILERLNEGNLEAIADVLAVHFWEAEVGEKAIHYGYQAAEKAQKAYNNGAAVEWYEQVVVQINDLESGQQEQFLSILTSSLLNLGNVLELVGEWDGARKHYEEALELAQTAGDRSAVAWSQIALGELSRKQGAFEEALDWFEKAGGEFEAFGDREGLAQVYHDKGSVAGQQADLEKAYDCFTESLALRRELGDEAGIANLLNNLALVAEHRGQYEEAFDLHEQALTIRRELGDRQMIASSLSNLGFILMMRGKYEAARENLTEAVSLQRDTGDRWLLANALNNLGNVARETGSIVEAHELYAESLTIYLELLDPWAQAYLLDDVARLIYLEGDAQNALRLVEAAMSLRNNATTPLPLLDQEALDDFASEVEKTLGDAAAEIVEEGQAMGADEALKLALRLVSEPSI